MKPIFLVGLPGSGKSTLGKALAAYLAYKFIDLDHLIEQVESQSISEIFMSRGEDVFRKLEENVLTTTLNLNNTVVSTGGGTPCFYSNMDNMLENGHVIWLNPSTKDIGERLTKGQQRPLFLNVDPIVKLNELQKERFPFYNKSHFSLQPTASDTITSQVLSISKFLKTLS